MPVMCRGWMVLCFLLPYNYVYGAQYYDNGRDILVASVQDDHVSLYHRKIYRKTVV